MVSVESAVLQHGLGTAPLPGPAGDSVNALRFLAVDAVDAVEAAGSGHPGTAMALAPLVHRLFTEHIRHDPAAPEWQDRDRVVLSIGHASLLLYGALHLSGYGVTAQTSPDSVSGAGRLLSAMRSQFGGHADGPPAPAPTA